MGFLAHSVLKDVKLPCIFALQTEKLEQMQEGEPIKIRGKLVAYKDQLQYEHLDPGTYTYVLILDIQFIMYIRQLRKQVI